MCSRVTVPIHLNVMSHTKVGLAPCQDVGSPCSHHLKVTAHTKVG